MSEFFEQMDRKLGLDPFKASTYSALTLAYIGDSIYDLTIRTMIMNRGNKAVGKMHKEASGYVNANTQSQMYYAVMPYLTEEEVSVMKRGRNANSGRAPKNATLSSYKHATGFEALLGYLYINDSTERVFELIGIGLEDFEKKRMENNDNR